MCNCDRRGFLAVLGSGLLAAGAAAPTRAETSALAERAGRARHFIAEAERMRIKAVASGDQSFGAVVVKGEDIVGWGPSRVVLDRNPRAHAERVAIWDAQLRLAEADLAGAVLYSTSRPCPACEDAAALAGISRMYWGPDGTDAGAPRRR